jgi:hypothetical protein
MFTDDKTKWQLVGDGDNPSIANCRKNIPTIFRRIFGLFREMLTFLCVYSTISRGTPNDVPRNRGWEILILLLSHNLKQHCYIEEKFLKKGTV